MNKLLIATSSFGEDPNILKKLNKKFILSRNNTGKKLDKKAYFNVEESRLCNCWNRTIQQRY